MPDTVEEEPCTTCPIHHKNEVEVLREEVEALTRRVEALEKHLPWWAAPGE